MRIFTHRGRGWLAATAAVATLGLAASTHAQYAPYGAGQSQNGAGQVQNNPYATSQPQYAAQGAYQGYTAPQAGYAQPQYAQPQYAQPQTPAQQSYAQQQNYGPQYATPRVAMAFQGASATTPTPTVTPENLSLNSPSEAVPPGPMQTMPNGGYAPQPTPTSENYGAAAGTAMGYGGAGGYESYPAAGDGASAYGACDTSGYGCNTYSTYGGMGGVLKKGAGCGYWFGGVYGLLMDRDDAYKVPLAFAVADGAPSGYYPPSSSIVLRSRDADIGFQGGAEFRLGRTFGGGGVANLCDPCGTCACGPRWGLEGVYWQIFQDDATTYYYDQPGLRTMSMNSYAGLQYDPTGTGTSYRPVNEYFDYGPPVQTNDILVTQARVYSSFQVQNAEVNLLRLGVCGGGFGPTASSVGCGPSECGGTCNGGCDSACTGAACATSCTPCRSRYSCTGVCGFRWMRFDEDFMYGIDYYNNTTAMPGYLNSWSTAQNNLFGAQIGCNGMYRIGCKWGLHLNSAFGLYGNDIRVRQYMATPAGGAVTFIGSGENFDVTANKTDVSMIGELRLGASYQYSCRCRVYGGWRVIGVTGLALATDQGNAPYLDSTQLTRYVNSNGSLILHGLQAGVEWNY